MKLLNQTISALLLSSSLRILEAAEAEFNALIAMLEADVLELARKVALLYENRCSEDIFTGCARSNYHECMSLSPNQTCPGGKDYNVAKCGDGISCSGLLDFSVSNVRLHSKLVDFTSGNPLDPNVIDTVCFTQQLDEFFIKKREERKPYWDKLGLQTPQMYFGSQNGAFRIYPARHSEECGQYDPTVRAWKIAADSGPKNVVLVLDTSSSMGNYNRLGLLQDAAIRIVETLSVGDRIAIVQFSSQAKPFESKGQTFFWATKENKIALKKYVENLELNEGTNTLDAFNKTFAVLDDSIDQELHNECITAVLFLTDGVVSPVMNETKSETETKILDLVTAGISNLEARTKQPVFLFTFSVSDNNSVHEFPKRLACSTGENGFWSKIVDADKSFDSLTSYYRLLAIAMSSVENRNFTAWVEPYNYAFSNILGTTVSAPVYDQSGVAIGVVGVDTTNAALDTVLGVPNGSQESIQRIVRRSFAKCPNFNLTLCQRESYRRSGSAKDDALCTSSCTADDFVVVKQEPCERTTARPSELFVENKNLQDVSYAERGCCIVGESDAASPGQCKAVANNEETSNDTSNTTGVDTSNETEDDTDEDKEWLKVLIYVLVGVGFSLLAAGLIWVVGRCTKRSFFDSHRSARNTDIRDFGWNRLKPVQPINTATNPNYVSPVGSAPPFDDL
jgi:hypothetical protein